MNDHASSSSRSSSSRNKNNEEDIIRNLLPSLVGNPSAEDKWRQVRLFVGLALPSAIVQWSAYVPPFVICAYVGQQYGSDYLSGASLAITTGNIVVLAVLQGFFTASDTLSPQAFAAKNFKEVGVLAIRGVIGSFILILPTLALLWIYMEPVLLALGQAAATALWATEFFRIMAVGLPFYAIYLAIWRFLAAQSILMPLVYDSVFCLLIVLPLSMVILTRIAGFRGAAWTTVVYQVAQGVFILIYLKWKQPHVRKTWPGVLWGEALQMAPFRHFFTMGLKGVVSRSEWFYTEIMTLMIGTFGAVELSSQAIAYQVTAVAFLFPSAVAGALPVRIGYVLPRNVHRTERMVVVASLYSTVLLTVVAMIIYVFRGLIFSLFTTEQAVLDGCELIWSRVCYYYVNVSVQLIVSSIGAGLGIQGIMARIYFVSLWCVGLPLAYYVVIVRGGGLNGARSVMLAPCAILNTTSYIVFYLMDWSPLSKAIREREGLEFEIMLPAPEKTFKDQASRG